MTTAEEMAVAVLRVDLVAAHALCDLLMEAKQPAAKELVPLRTLKLGAGKVRAVMYFHESVVRDMYVDVNEVTRLFQQWVEDGTRPLMLVGVERVDLYEVD